MLNLYTALNMAILHLKALPQASPRLEAELLISCTLNKPRSFIIAWPKYKLNSIQYSTFTNLLQRRLNGEPIAYILGEWEFWNLTLQITPSVLIPRPETELLVELALAVGDRCFSNISKPLEVADLGTGSGAIAAAIARERPLWTIHATDFSAAALAVARANFQSLNLPISTYLGFWYNPLPTTLRLDLIISNPPYIAACDPHLYNSDLVKEPQCALVAGTDGLDALRILCNEAVMKLNPHGVILLEHGYNQGYAVRNLLRHAGMKYVHTWVDFAGHERVTGGNNYELCNLPIKISADLNER